MLGAYGYDWRVVKPGYPRRNRRSRSNWTLATVVLLAWLVIASCSLPTPPEPPKTVTQFDLIADVPIAAAQIELGLEPGTTLVSVEPLRENLLVRSAADDGRIYLAWIGGVALSGPQVKVTYERAVTGDGPPALLEASSYSGEAGEDLGAAPLRWRESTAPTAAEWAAGDSLSPVPSSGRLEAWFAEHPLGDVRRSGSVDVRDGLRLLDRLRYGSWDDFELYQGDLDGNGFVGGDDLEALLLKIVDPNLPARLVVKPAELRFVQLAGATAEPALVLVANGGRQPFRELTWEAPPGTTVTVRGGIRDASAALELGLPAANRIGWRPGFARILDGSGGEAAVRVGHLVALIGGQSNAVGWGQPLSGWPEAPSSLVRMLGNDYRWAAGVEPLDSALNQVDTVSADANAAYSFGSRLGHLLSQATGFATYLIPSPKGSSRVTLTAGDGGWLPGSPTDRSTLFGSAVFRSRVSAGLEANPVASQPFAAEGGPVNVLLWYQGESDATFASRRAAFADSTRTVVNAFQAQLDVPVVYVQLASHEYAAQNSQQHWIAERQRRMETGSGAAESSLLSNHHMVVAFDLPRSDHIHLSAYGQRLLAERLDLAIRQHVLGEEVDGTGPRLVGIEWDGGTTVVLRTTHVLQAGPLDADYFGVFDGPPNGVTQWTDPAEGSNTLPIASVVTHPSDPTSVLVRLAATLTPGAKPYVVYRAPAGIGAELGQVIKRDLIRSAHGVGAEQLGLPLPAFGPIAP